MSDYEYWYAQKIADSDKYPFTIGQLRHMLQYRHRNGLEDVVRKVGKRLLFRMDLFNSWIEDQKNRGSKNE